MSTTTLTAAPVARPGALRRILSSLSQGYEAHMSRRRTRLELSALSDRELDDIGISRADIASIASGKLPY